MAARCSRPVGPLRAAAANAYTIRTQSSSSRQRRGRDAVDDPREHGRVQHFLEQRADLADVVAGLFGQRRVVPGRRVGRLLGSVPTCAAGRRRSPPSRTSRATGGFRSGPARPAARLRGAWPARPPSSLRAARSDQRRSPVATASVRSQRSMANLATSWSQMACSRQWDANRPEHENSPPSGSSSATPYTARTSGRTNWVTSTPSRGCRR